MPFDVRSEEPIGVRRGAGSVAGRSAMTDVATHAAPAADAIRAGHDVPRPQTSATPSETTRFCERMPKVSYRVC